MTDENKPEGSEVPAGEAQETESKIENLDEALKEIAKLRREAAGKRVKNKELEEKASKWEEYTQSQKTELEKLADRANQLEEEADKLRRENLRNKVLVKYKIDAEYEDLLSGKTLEELEAQAKKLASVVKSSGSGKPDFYAGQRGKAPTPAAETLDDWFKDWWKQTSTNKP